jgi:bacteriocin biosynthesis cyclodehydratase domain-containing protein
LFYSTFSYWSVDPGRSPCRLCLELSRDDQLLTPEGATFAAGELIKPGPVNRATGPVVQIMAGLMTMEAMRFLNHTDPPVALAAYQSIELADGMTVERHPWNRHPDCPLCERAGAQPR